MFKEAVVMFGNSDPWPQGGEYRICCQKLKGDTPHLWLRDGENSAADPQDSDYNEHTVAGS